jgi:hypothetical protein
LTITSGSEVTTNATLGAEFDSAVEVRACSVVSGNKVISSV